MPFKFYKGGDVFDTNGEKYAFGDDLYMLADYIKEYLSCEYGIRKYNKISEATFMAASSEEQHEINEIAKTRFLTA